ncbi:hypothetical protein BKA70DRAFT_715092 [Coprinopsis sp. MPI-PUGE-AT-0042]|nr:hypothetical protein BKA70DRAFT_715092 [Coprinopsis sp. MPI-PUGE-AT-0042]
MSAIAFPVEPQPYLSAPTTLLPALYHRDGTPMGYAPDSPSPAYLYVNQPTEQHWQAPAPIQPPQTGAVRTHPKQHQHRSSQPYDRCLSPTRQLFHTQDVNAINPQSHHEPVPASPVGHAPRRKSRSDPTHVSQSVVSSSQRRPSVSSLMGALAISPTSPRVENSTRRSSRSGSVSGHTVIKSEFPPAINLRHTSHSPRLSSAASPALTTASLPNSRREPGVSLNLCRACSLRSGASLNSDIKHASAAYSNSRGPHNHVVVPQGIHDARAGHGVHPPVEFQIHGYHELGVQVKKALDKRMPITHGGGDQVFKRVSEKKLNLHIMWPGYPPTIKRLDTKSGQITRQEVLQAVAQSLKEWGHDVKKQGLKPSRGCRSCDAFAVGTKVAVEDAFITEMVHRGSSHWQVEVWTQNQMSLYA